MVVFIRMHSREVGVPHMSIRSKQCKRNKGEKMENSLPVYAVTGELTIAVAAEIKAKVVAWLSDGQVVTLDLSGVSRVDCAGLQVIIAAARTGRVALSSLSLAVHRAIETIGYVPADLAKEG